MGHALAKEATQGQRLGLSALNALQLAVANFQADAFGCAEAGIGIAGARRGA